MIQYPIRKIDTLCSIPDSVTSIREEAFYQCTSLTSIKIPTGVTFIDLRAFEGGESIKSKTILDGICSIEASFSSVTLKKGKTKALKIKQIYAQKNEKPTLHMRLLTYTTSDKTVATVTSKGVIRAKGKGSCYIYITAYSGVYTKVTVKE